MSLHAGTAGICLCICVCVCVHALGRYCMMVWASSGRILKPKFSYDIKSFYERGLLQNKI